MTELDDVSEMCMKIRELVSARIDLLADLYASDNVIHKALGAVLFEDAVISENQYIDKDAVALMRDVSPPRVFCGKDALPRLERLVERVKTEFAKGKAPC